MSLTDFEKLTVDGSIMWSTGTERLYLAIPNNGNPQIVELLADEHTVKANVLAFEGEVDEGLLEQNGVYEVWYFGNSHTLGGTSYVSTTESAGMITKIDGSIANQSGSLSDLGYYHIAKAEVTATLESDGSFTLPLNGTLKNQMAIAYMDLSETTKLKGSAIIGTDHSLEYTDGEYKFIVDNETSVINIEGENENLSESFVVLLPNANDNVDIENDNWEKYTFRDGIVASNFYYKYISEVSIGTLKWEDNSIINGNAFVDLGLPSGLFWATCNVGASSPEEAGSLYAWGESETKYEYTLENSYTYGKYFNDISGNTKLDAATVNFGSEWRMPKQSEFNELFEHCGWESTSQNGVEGYKFIGTNGNYIFLPAAGSYDSGGGVFINERGSYWTSTPTTIEENRRAYYLVFLSTNKIVGSDYRDNGRSIRPVSGRKFDIGEVTTAEVTSITDNSAVCGGYVTGNNAYVTEKGICWSTSENPTINDNKMACGQGEGEYTVTLTGLTSATVYYVRAYATNEAGTNYGSQVRFNTTKTGSNGYVYDFSNMGSHIVDLGLPSGVLWSDCNIGAEWAVEQTEWPVNIYGNYFMWACNTSSQYFGEGNYPDYAKAITINSESDYGYNYSGDIRYDAATNLWGGNWRTPTAADIDELKEYCTPLLLTILGKDGIEIECLKFTSKLNGKSIYFPLGGVYYDSSELDHRNDLGYYLTANIYNRTSCRDWILRTESDCHRGWDLRWYGYSLRPVIGPIPE